MSPEHHFVVQQWHKCTAIGHQLTNGLESSVNTQQTMSTLLQVRLLCSGLLLQFQGYCLPRSVSQTSHWGAVKNMFSSCRSLTWHTFCICHVKSSSTHTIYLSRNGEASTQCCAHSLQNPSESPGTSLIPNVALQTPRWFLFWPCRSLLRGFCWLSAAFLGEKLHPLSPLWKMLATEQRYGRHNTKELQ